MDADALRGLMFDVASGRVDPDQAVRRLQRLPFVDVGLARIDHHRALRQGLPEAVYGPGKTAEEVAVVVAELLDGGTGPVVLSRADKAQVEAALAVDATGTVLGRTAVWRRASVRGEKVLVVTAGTADAPIADECAAVLWAHGIDADRLADVGVSGLHRLLADGLTGAPVVAVPTSVGYGASLDGVTALLGMLASCASGLTVVGIDNGFGAACAVVRQLGPRRADAR